VTGVVGAAFSMRVDARDVDDVERECALADGLDAAGRPNLSQRP
jgi:hypothetical protein